MPIKVAIVEDNSGIRESLAILIKGTPGFCCHGTYVNAEEALRQIPKDWPDVILMDINLPQMSGIECVAKLKSLRPALYVIMLTVYVDSDQIFKSLMAGASGYLIKQTPPAEIIDAITTVHQGGAPMSNAIARQVVQYFHQKQSMVESENLTRRELEILTYLSKGFHDKEIASQLNIGVVTIRTHIRSIYDKLHVRSRTEAVAKFLGGGR